MKFTFKAKNLYEKFNREHTHYSRISVLNSGASKFGRVYYLFKDSDKDTNKLFENGLIFIKPTSEAFQEGLRDLMPDFIYERPMYIYDMLNKVFLSKYQELNKSPIKFRKVFQNETEDAINIEPVTFNYLIKDTYLITSAGEVYLALDENKNIKFNFTDITIDVDNKDVKDCIEARKLLLDQF